MSNDTVERGVTSHLTQELGLVQRTGICTDDEGTKIFRHTVGGQTYSFNVDYLPDIEHEWFCKVVGSLMDDINRKASVDAENRIKSEFRKLIGI